MSHPLTPTRFYDGPHDSGLAEGEGGREGDQGYPAAPVEDLEHGVEPAPRDRVLAEQPEGRADSVPRQIQNLVANAASKPGPF